MPSFGKRVDVPGGRRRTIRQRVVLVGSATTMEGTRSVVLDDICATGARLRGRDLPAKGAEMIVKVGSTDIFASVAWNVKDQCGITFDTVLNQNGVQQLKEAGSVGQVFRFV